MKLISRGIALFFPLTNIGLARAAKLNQYGTARYLTDFMQVDNCWCCLLLDSPHVPETSCK